MMIDSEKKNITKTIRSLCAHPVFTPHNLPLKLLITVRVKFKILHFCMELALSLWLFEKKYIFNNT